MMVLGEASPPPRLDSSVPELSPGEALMVGSVFELARWAPKVTVAADMLLRAAGTDATLATTGDLGKLAAALRKHPKWRGRIRRCDYDGGAAEGCHRYFVDRSPGANAHACSPGHAVRMAEAKSRARSVP